MADQIKKMCPHCASTMFAAEITRGCVVEMYSEATADGVNHKILKESSGKYELEVVQCVRCKAALKEEDLIVGVPCKECGKVTTPDEIDENGLCSVCSAVKQRSELANASREDLIRMLLNAEKKANPVATQVAKQMEKAEEVSASAPVTTETTDVTEGTDVVETAEAETTTEEPKRKRRATRKKADDAATDESVAEEVTTEVVEETTGDDIAIAMNAPEVQTDAVADIANQQEAPFPDVEVPQEEQQTQTVQATTPVNGGFQMFPDDEDRF